MDYKREYEQVVCDEKLNHSKNHKCNWEKDFESVFGVVAKCGCTGNSEPIRAYWKYCPYCGNEIDRVGNFP